MSCHKIFRFEFEHYLCISHDFISMIQSFANPIFLTSGINFMKWSRLCPLYFLNLFSLFTHQIYKYISNTFQKSGHSSVAIYLSHKNRVQNPQIRTITRQPINGVKRNERSLIFQLLFPIPTYKCICSMFVNSQAFDFGWCVYTFVK